MVNEFKANTLRIENNELMPIPKIEVRREKGVELLVGFLASQKQPPEDNDEAMEWIALTYTHPEWKEKVLNKIKKDKSFIKNPEELYEKTINSLKEYEKSSSSIDLSEEVKKRKEMLPKYKEQILNSIEYFRPNIKTSDIKEVVIIPCDKLLSRVETGRGIDMGNTNFIMSHTENPDNFDHEFLHGFINPITEKFTEYFESEEQRKKIFEFTNGGIEGYGNYPVSVLNEEIIQTYNIHIKKSRLIVKNELRKRLISFYKVYENSKKADKSLSFEKYFSDNYKKILY
ncbi:MAG TPA: hypothetical protein PKZ36_00670 [Candidatus Paceibacterota bacterium]|nr:hypothetical protein [Candidatus Paceibacterota bacterium]HPT17912.1 hypothetical protein [Candidatus Paceibacterota bacterium]